MKWLFLLDTCTKKEHTHPFNGPFSGTTRVNWCQKGKTNLDFTEARDSEWQWHQLGHIQVCISLQTDNHASTPPLRFFTGRMPFLPPIQQCQSTECNKKEVVDIELPWSIAWWVSLSICHICIAFVSCLQHMVGHAHHYTVLFYCVKLD